MNAQTYISIELDFRNYEHLHSTHRIRCKVPEKHKHTVGGLIEEAHNHEQLYDSTHVYAILDALEAVEIEEEYREEIAEGIFISRWI